MANSKISALTSATTPLVGTETLPIVQGGATVKTTVADITNGGGYAGSFTTLSATGVTTVQAGTALLPAVTTTGDTNTGIFFPAADTIAFTEGGAEAVRINSSGNVGIANTLSLSNPVGGTTTFADPDGSTVDGYLRIGNETLTTNRNSVLELIGYGGNGGGTFGGGAIVFTNTRYGSSSSPSFSQVAAITGKRDGSGTGLLKFWTGSTTALQERVRIDSVGNAQFQAGAVMPYAPAPAGISAAATLTNANIQAQIISATGTTYTITMPLGTTMETLATWATTGIAYDFYVINTATGVITMAVNTGVTSLGSLTVGIAASAHFRIRRTAANTFVLYRLN